MVRDSLEFCICAATFRGIYASILRLLMEVIMFLQNFGTDLLNYTTSNLRKPCFHVYRNENFKIHTMLITFSRTKRVSDNWLSSLG